MSYHRLRMSNRHCYPRNSAGYLKRCDYCGTTIYLKEDCDKRWRPYESWAAGNVSENEWELHQCQSPAEGGCAA